MVVKQNIMIDLEALSDLCRRYDVRELALFGSVVRDDFRSESDIDVLVEFLPEARVGLFRYVELQEELAALFGRKVDLVSKVGLKPVIRDSVLGSSKLLFSI